MANRQIERAIKLAGGTQSDLAEALGVSRQTVWNWVTRGKVPGRQAAEMVKLWPELDIQKLAFPGVD